MDPDVILSQIRELAANATRPTRARSCTDDPCYFRERTQPIVELFITLDEALTNGGLIPMAWAGGPDIPAPRQPLED